MSYLSQSTFHVVYSVAGLFAFLRMSFHLIQYHQTVRLVSGVGKSSLIDHVFRVGEVIRMMILYYEVGVRLAVNKPFAWRWEKPASKKNPKRIYLNWNLILILRSPRLHHFKGFEPGYTEAFDIVSEFIH